MDKTIRRASVISLLAVTAAACTPNPYYTGYNYGSANTQTSGVVNRGGVSHTHCGRTHSHPLPPEGLAHHHGDGCMAGSGGGTTTSTTATTTPNYNYGYNQQPATTTYNYSTPTTTPYYDYSASAGNNYSAGSNTSSSYNYSGSYSDYTAPKTTVTPRTVTPPAASNTTTSGFYTVQKGDTVFQVMRNTGVYWKDIIRLNNLQAPNYPINPGQTLRLK